MGCRSGKGLAKRRAGLFPLAGCLGGCYLDQGIAKRRVGLFPLAGCSTGCRSGKGIAKREIAILLRESARELIYRDTVGSLAPVHYTHIAYATVQSSNTGPLHQGPNCLNAV